MNPFSSACPRSLSWLDHLARFALLRKLRRAEGGVVTLRDSMGSAHLGQSADITATVTVHNPRLYRSAFWGGTLGVAESYRRGDWQCDQLTNLFRICLRNRSVLRSLEGGLAQPSRLLNRWWHRCRGNTIPGSRRNIAAHYDVGNDFYRLWLDETMAYSSGVFPSPDSSLFEASQEKFDRICRKLDLHPRDQVVEIGSGWGGFAIHAAGQYGCHVTTTTISPAQFAETRRRVEEAGLSDRVTVLRQDYRHLHGKFDKLVSIEMIESVGNAYFDVFFRRCGQLLRPHGCMALQAILMPERRYRAYLRSVDFIQRYIFPGGSLPSLAAILGSVGRASPLRLTHVEDFAGHYARTLQFWREALQEREHDASRLGYSPEFLRTWYYYLSYCEAGFAERQLHAMQMIFSMPEHLDEPMEICQRLASNSGPLFDVHIGYDDGAIATS